MWVSLLGARAEAAPPEPPTNVAAIDKPWDGGGVVFVSWDAPASSSDALMMYEILAKELDQTPVELADETAAQADRTAAEETEAILEGEGIAPQEADQRARLVAPRQARGHVEQRELVRVAGELGCPATIQTRAREERAPGHTRGACAGAAMRLVRGWSGRVAAHPTARPRRRPPPAAPAGRSVRGRP